MSDITASAGFRRVLAAEAASNFGSMLSRLAIPWLATLVLGATPLQMGLLLVADVLAGLLATLWLGTLVDRSAKRAVMIGADLLCALLLGAVALAALLQWLNVALLLLAAAAGGMLTVGFELARSAWMAQALAQQELARRNAQLSAAGSLSETAAFALGGWLFQWWGAALALAVDGLSYLVSALCLRGVPEARTSAAAAAGVSWRALMAQSLEGISTLRHTPTLRTIAVVQALVALSISLTGTCYMIFVARDVGLATGSIGMIAASGGLGAIAGAALAPGLGRRLGSGRALALGLLLAALGTACIPAVPGAGWAAVALLVTHQIVGDSGATLYEVHSRTLRQTLAPAALQARVDAGIRTLGQGATLAGALGGGALATWAGTRAALVLSALVLMAAALAAWRMLGRR